MATLQGALKRAKSAGRYGDTDIVHVNPQEKRALKYMGGAGTINPETGLREYFDPRGAGGVGRNDPGQRARDKEQSDRNKADASKGRIGGKYADIGFGTGNYSNNGTTISRNKPGRVGGPGIGPSEHRAFADTSGYGVSSPNNPEGITARHGSFGTGAPPASTQPSQADLNTQKAFNDFRDLGNSGVDNLGNAIASGFGFNETNPYGHTYGDNYGLPGSPNQNPSITGGANWSLNPAQLAASIAGLATGYPIGSLLRGLSYLSGTRLGPEINLGANVMGSPSTPSTTTGDIVGGLADATPPAPTVATDAPNFDFQGPISTALSRSPFNSKIGGFGAGGWAGGGSSNKSKARNPLAQALMAPKF